jgi:glycosyltransferase involved in cell wall biosynthesis
VKERSLEDLVKFSGIIDRENLPKIYGSSEVLVQPSTLEGFSIVLIEAMSAGLPVVASETQGMKELINEGKNGLLFRPGSFREMAYKIGLLLRDETLRKTVIENGYKTVENFTVDRMVGRTESLYQSLVEAHEG